MPALVGASPSAEVPAGVLEDAPAASLPEASCGFWKALPPLLHCQKSASCGFGRCPCFIRSASCGLGRFCCFIRSASCRCCCFIIQGSACWWRRLWWLGSPKNPAVVWTDIRCENCHELSGQFKLAEAPGMREPATWFMRVRLEDKSWPTQGLKFHRRQVRLVGRSEENVPPRMSGVDVS